MLLKKYMYALASCLLLTAATSCQSSLEEEVVLEQNATHVCTMHFDGQIDEFSATRAAMNIQDGTKLYVKFYNGMVGTAVYHSKEKEWALTYNGDIKILEGRCELYFLNLTEASGKVALDYTKPVYGTKSATYAFETVGGSAKSVTVKGNLLPYVSRVRFKGGAGTSISVSGMKCCSYYDVASATFASEAKTVSLTVANNGFTDYVYYLEPNGAQLTVTVSGDKKYSIQNPLASGGFSGYINIPTAAEHTGWTVE